MTQTKAAGYIRVSTAGQEEKYSIPAQRKMIKKYCNDKNYKFTKFYDKDAGKSGTTMEGCESLKQALQDAHAGKYNVLVIRDISRIGRNLLEFLQNKQRLDDAGVQLQAVKENIQDTLMTQIKAAVAEDETKKIAERMMEGKIEAAEDGKPVGPLPWGRTYDKKTDEWGLQEGAKQAIGWAAEEFLGGKPMQDVAIEADRRFSFAMKYNNLVQTLKFKCGDTQVVNFPSRDRKIIQSIPRLLDDDTIDKIKAQLKRNKKYNRTDSDNEYLLNEFLYCHHCEKAFTGQKQRDRQGVPKYGYYNHPGKKATDACNKVPSVRMKPIEDQVLEGIFESMGDAKGFEDALANLPDDEQIKKWEAKEQSLKKELQKIEQKKEKLFKRSLGDIFDEERIKAEMNDLNDAEDQIEEELGEVQHKLANAPDPKEIKRNAEKSGNVILKSIKMLSILRP